MSKSKHKRKNRISNGYILVYKPDYPYRIKTGAHKDYIYEHIYVATKNIGRDLYDHEVVHHLDHDKTNNDIENLIVLSRSDHAKLHAWLNATVMVKKPGWEKRTCKICDKKLVLTIKYCSDKCRSVARRRVKWDKLIAAGVIEDYPEPVVSKDPGKEVLIEELKSFTSMTEFGKRFDVSDNTAKKWLRKHDLLSLIKKSN